MQFFLLWLKRFFLSRQHFVRWTPLVSIFSLILAVSTLTLALSVYSGYENTVRQAVLDMTGHLMITAPKPVPKKTLLKKIKSCCLSQNKKNTAPTNQNSVSQNKIIAIDPFLSLPILVLREGKLSGALLEGLPVAQNKTSIKWQNRIKAGAFQLKDLKSAIIGQSLAQKLKMRVGDVFHAVAPKMDSKGTFHKTYQELKVEGIVDMGFYDFNARWIITNIKTAQHLGKPQEDTALVSGARLLLNNPAETKQIRFLLKKALGPSYKVEDWEDIVKSRHNHYFQAVQKEKILIFFILMVLVLAGAFNVSSHLTISILNQARSISILKAMGARDIFVFSLLLTQGFIISFIGTMGGIALGWALSSGFVALQNVRPLIPSEIYKVSQIVTTLKISDILMIIFCSQVICLVSCFLPALRALKMTVRDSLLAD